LGVLLVLVSMPDGLGGLAFRIRDRFLAWAARRHGLSSLALDRTHLGADDADAVLANAAASVAAGTSTDAESTDADRTEPDGPDAESSGDEPAPESEALR